MRSRRHPALRPWPTIGLLFTLLCAGAIGATEMAGGDTSSPEFDCVIEPQQIVKLASPVVGVVARLDVDRGDRVSKGQIVGKLEDGVEEAALNLARARASNEHTIKSIQARLHYLRRKHARLEELHSKAVGSLASLEEAEAESKAVEQQLKESELSKELAHLQMLHSEQLLYQRTLRSPIDGIVVERLLVPGEYRNEQTPILTLADIGVLRVEVFVPIAYYTQIMQGNKASVAPELPFGGSYAATVIVVDRVLDAASGTFGVRLSLPNDDLRLPAGIRCKISFELQRDGTGAALAKSRL